MPRNANGLLRNRNRVTNKTRLKVVRGNIDADPLILDDEEERARVIATSGVDAEDANEHHLQVAINAAAQRHAGIAHDDKTSGSPSKQKREDYIPTPDAAGLVTNYEENYPPNRWSQPHTHLRFSDTVEDTVRDAVSNGYSYVMDERDVEWLEKNNQEAKGEGTSTQAAITGATTRASRNAKTKGKEPESAQPVFMNEDEFELVMAVFEKCTDDRFPCLHVDVSQIPPFADYEQLFAPGLPVSYFSGFVLPDFASNSSRIISLARVVYTHWRDRRIERGGKRIIPQLNDDESNENDPYVCFRRRDSKPIRKTRASQTAITDRLVKLKTELAQSYALAHDVLRREELKQKAWEHSHDVWKARSRLLDLKRKHAISTTREEEELLLDKERSPKKQKAAERPAVSSQTPKSRPAETPPPQVELRVWPKDRYQKLQQDITDEVNKQRDKNSTWEDVVDLPYQFPNTERWFTSLQAEVTDDVPAQASLSQHKSHLSYRLRRGRGGRIHIDRMFAHRIDPLRANQMHDRSGLSISSESEEWSRKLDERWRYDSDATTLVEGEDRFLLDDYNPKYLRYAIHLLSEEDRSLLSAETPTVYNHAGQLRLFAQQRRGLEDSARIASASSNQHLSPPPPTVPSSVPLNAVTYMDAVKRSLSSPQIVRGINGIANGNISPLGNIGFLQQQQRGLVNASDSNLLQPPTTQLEEGSVPLTRPQPLGSPTNHVVASHTGVSNGGILVDSPSTYSTPSIARHRIHGPPIISPTQGSMNGHPNGVYSSNPVNHLPPDITPHQIMQLKHSFANPGLHAQGMVGFQSMSPPPRPPSHMQPMMAVPGQDVGIASMNLRLPSNKIVRRASPQLNGTEILSANSHSSNGSPVMPFNGSPMMRATSVGGNHFSPPPHRGALSPANGGMFPHAPGSPHPSMLSGQSPPGHGSPIISAATLRSPQRPPSTIPVPIQRPQSVNGLSHSTF